MTLDCRPFSESRNPQANALLGDFVSVAIWSEPGRFERFCSLGIFRDERLAAGIIYHNWQKDVGVVEMSAGAMDRRWITRPVLREMFSIPFDLLNCQAVVARHSEDRHDLRRMWTAIGGVEHVIPRLRGRNAPAEAVTILTEEAWRKAPYAAEKVKERVIG